MSKETRNFLKRHSIGIAGTRRLEPYPNQMAERLARDLAARGLLIGTGSALGIDATAQKGALGSTEGATAGIPGCGGGGYLSEREPKDFC